MVEGSLSLNQTLFWMNIHLELLAVQQKALGQIRDLVRANSGRSYKYEPDVRLVETEIERVLIRLTYWEEMVDRAKRVLMTP